MHRVQGQKGRTEEHCFPKWLADHIEGATGDKWLHIRARTDSGVIDHQFTKRELAVVSRRVCRTCNNGWMNDLERQVEGYLLTMLRGNSRTYHHEGQRALATWAVKTALCLELANPNVEPIPTVHYRAMASSSREPPPKTQVFLGAYWGPRDFFHWPSRINEMADGVHGYLTTFIVGHAIFQVFGHTDDEEVTLLKNRVWHDVTPQIWPTLAGLRWPPKLIMDEAALWRYVKN